MPHNKYSASNLVCYSPKLATLCYFCVQSLQRLFITFKIKSKPLTLVYKPILIWSLALLSNYMSCSFHCTLASLLLLEKAMISPSLGLFVYAVSSAEQISPPSIPISGSIASLRSLLNYLSPVKEAVSILSKLEHLSFYHSSCLFFLKAFIITLYYITHLLTFYYLYLALEDKLCGGTNLFRLLMFSQLLKQSRAHIKYS